MLGKMTIEIVNLKFYKGKCEYIGRPSILGNPFSHREKSIAKYKVASVEEAISKYKDWLFNNLDNEQILAELYRLADIAESDILILGCWCVPFHDCHGEIIKELIEYILEERSNERLAKNTLKK